MSNLLCHLSPCVFPFRVRQFVGALLNLINHPVILLHQLANFIISFIFKMFTFLAHTNRSKPFTEHSKRRGEPSAYKDSKTHCYNNKEKSEINDSNNQI